MHRTTDAIERISKEIAFDFVGSCSTDDFQTMPEVRNMCAANLCQYYGKSWSCPPACGTIEEYQERMNAFEHCVVVQSVGQMEDPFDFETVQETAEIQNERFRNLINQLREKKLNFLPLGAGPCMLCRECSYPDEPCRFPGKMVVSMEASGLMVNAVCTKASIPYNHGENTISFTGCVLI